MFHFPSQREGEEVLELVHKHVVVYVKIVAFSVLIIVLPVIFFLYFWFIAYPLADFFQRGVVVGIFVSLYFLYSLLFTCIKWINEEFDVFIITTDRLIDVTQITFLSRSVTSTPLAKIQDTTGDVHGFLPTIFHYGNLTVQTAAGGASDFFIDHVSEPEETARKILDWALQKREGKKIVTAH